MKTIISVLVLLFLVLTGCYEEKNTLILENTFFEYEKDFIFQYESISESNKHLIYTEDFTKETSEWWTGEDDNFSADIKFGEYQLSNSDRNLLEWLFTNWSIDPNKNFQIEAVIRINSSADDDGGGFGIGDADGNWISIILNHKNEVSVNKWNKNQEKVSRPLDWEEKYWIDSFHGTLLTIRRIENQYIFFADKKYIGLNLMQNELNATRILFYLKGNVGMYVDYISMHYLSF